jgi:hypothetical protein
MIRILTRLIQYTFLPEGSFLYSSIFLFSKFICSCIASSGPLSKQKYIRVLHMHCVNNSYLDKLYRIWKLVVTSHFITIIKGIHSFWIDIMHKYFAILKALPSSKTTLLFFISSISIFSFILRFF